MRIAVYAHLLTTGSQHAGAGYAGYWLQAMVQAFPQHSWILIYHKNSRQPPALPIGKQVEHYVKGHRPVSSLGWCWWYGVVLKRCLKAVQAHLFIDLEGSGVAGLDHLRQVLMICQPWTTVKGRKGPQSLAQGHASALNKRHAANTTLWLSHQQVGEQLAVKRNHVPAIILPAMPLPCFTPLSWAQQMHICEAFTEGSNFFMLVGPMHLPQFNWMLALKAFSAFKKWQKSSMKLVVVATEAANFTGFEEKLNTYKYRADVVWKGYVKPDAYAPLLASAYAMLYPAGQDGLAMPVAEAVASGTPVVTGPQVAVPPYAAPAVQVLPALSEEELGKALIQLYKNETYRSQLAHHARQINLHQTQQEALALCNQFLA